MFPFSESHILVLCTCSSSQFKVLPGGTRLCIDILSAAATQTDTAAAAGSGVASSVSVDKSTTVSLYLKVLNPDL